MDRLETGTERYGDRLTLVDGSDPLARYREMTDEQRLQEATTLLEEAYRVLERQGRGCDDREF